MPNSYLMRENSDLSMGTAGTLVATRLVLRVMGLGGELVTAVIWPTSTSAAHVRALVEWHGTDVLSSVVGAEGDVSTWGQGLLLVWAAAGTQSVRAVPPLGADRWCLARLTLPAHDGQGGGRIRVSLIRRRWRATLSRTNEPGLRKELMIPAELRHLEMGTLMAEMTCRLTLGRPWEPTVSGRG